MQADRSLKPFQRQGVCALKQILTRPDGHQGALLATLPGGGKTCQAITACREMGAKRILVLCPASLKLNWQREFEMWGEESWTSQVLNSSKDTWDAEKGITICSYHLACRQAILDVLSSVKWDFLLLDEAHAVKSPAAALSRVALVLLWRAARYRIAITGTPLPNGSAAEAWTLFSRLAPDLFCPWVEYKKRYCIEQETTWGVRYFSKNLDELRRLAMDRFMVRQPKEQVLGELPPLVRQYVPLEVEELKVFEALDGIDVGAIVAAVEAGVPLESDHISTARRKLGLLKVKPTLDFLETVLEEVKSVVVFCHHREVYQSLLDGLYAKDVSVVGINGLMSAEERQASVDAFQAGEAQVFLGSLRAANTGITLTRSSTVVIVEADWVPSTNEQAEGRIYRISQTEVSRAMYLVVPKSLDEAVVRSVTRKQRDINKVLEGTAA